MLICWHFHNNCFYLSSTYRCTTTNGLLVSAWAARDASCKSIILIYSSITISDLLTAYLAERQLTASSIWSAPTARVVRRRLWGSDGSVIAAMARNRTKIQSERSRAVLAMLLRVAVDYRGRYRKRPTWWIGVVWSLNFFGFLSRRQESEPWVPHSLWMLWSLCFARE